jgi:hypothetical protein
MTGMFIFGAGISICVNLCVCFATEMEFNFLAFAATILTARRHVSPA